MGQYIIRNDSVAGRTRGGREADVTFERRGNDTVHTQ